MGGQGEDGSASGGNHGDTSLGTLATLLACDVSLLAFISPPKRGDADIFEGVEGSRRTVQILEQLGNSHVSF